MGRVNLVEAPPRRAPLPSWTPPAREPEPATTPAPERSYLETVLRAAGYAFAITFGACVALALALGVLLLLVALAVGDAGGGAAD